MTLLQQLLSSKKFVAMLCGLIGIIALKVFKVNLDPATVGEIVGLVAVYIGAQGIADHGATAAAVTAIAAVEDGTPAAQIEAIKNV